jgi:hypothetical protein
MIPLRTKPNPAFKIVQPLPRLLADPLRQGFNRRAARTSTEPGVPTPQKPKGTSYNAPQISMPDIRVVIS